MPQVMEYVNQLASDVGPRPAATDAEATAADYIQDVFEARGLEVERQEFDCVRTTSWAYVTCHLLTFAGVALSFWLPIAGLVPAVLAAAALWLELDTRPGISRFLPKGPSQNIIARHVPRQRRGERLKRVVIVAHYDSARPSLAFSPKAVRRFGLLTALTKWTTLATPLVILVAAMPFASDWKPWTGYAALASAAWLVVPLLAAIHRELFMRATDGANCNASGVAAMFGVMEATVPEPDDVVFRDHPRRRSAEVAYDADIAPEDALLEYRPVGGEGEPPAEQAPLDGFGDIDWETGRLERVEQPEHPAAEPAPLLATASETPAEQAVEPERPAAVSSGDWAEDAGVGPLWEDASETAEPSAPTPSSWRELRRAAPQPAPVPVRWEAPAMPEGGYEEDVAEGQERLELESGAEPVQPGAEQRTSEEKQQSHGLSAWLGIGRGFDVRKAGKQIGSWDNIDEDDEFGFKAGTAGEIPPEDESTDVAARIRRRVTESIDRALAEKEIWFVATGADEVGGQGMRALLGAYDEDLKDALIINIENVGTGSIAFVTDEGMLRTYRADRRLVTQAKRTARENELAVKGRSLRNFRTSATPALARRFKAITVMGFDINGRVPNWRWHTDTVENIAEKTIDQAVGFVTALLRDL
ncbi:MAG: hypothetical protein EG823_02080 [Actinobacteria bacterium]|nr:hypothetical protein [Actinomycetota bacterium]